MSIAENDRSEAAETELVALAQPQIQENVDAMHFRSGSEEISMSRVSMRSKFHALQAPLLVLESHLDKTFNLRHIRRSELLAEAKAVSYISALLRHHVVTPPDTAYPPPVDSLPSAKTPPACSSGLPKSGKSRRASVAPISLLESLRSLNFSELRHKFFHTLTENERAASEIGICRAADLRKIDPTFISSAEPAIIVRRHCYIVNAIFIRGLVFHDKCFLLVPDGADELLEVFKERLFEDAEVELRANEEREAAANGARGVAFSPSNKSFENNEDEDNNISMDSKSSSRDVPPKAPFEFRALEAIMNAMQQTLEGNFAVVKERVHGTLHSLSHRPDTRSLLQLRDDQNDLNELTTRAKGVRDAIAELLGDDEDMAKMYLTALMQQPQQWESINAGDRDSIVHEEVECLLEIALEGVDSILSSVVILNESIGASQRVLELELDSQRNRLLKSDIVLSTVTLALAFGAAIASLFGMNIKSGVEDEETLFWALVIGALLFTGLMTSTVLFVMKRLNIF